MALAALLLCMGTALAQTKISGKVLADENGEPIIGATVKVVGKSAGASTDYDGRFSLTLPAGADKLQVSYLGMKTQEVDAKDGVVVRLVNEDEMLDEVVVVAFGTQKKEAFTGSAAFIKAEDLSKHITTNVANALVGSVSGLQMRSTSGAPGAGAGAMNIRGIASMYAGTDPLIIVDGAPYTASLSNIPQGDIESVSVLKDAASAALYGARGAAGVIIVTTKRGNRSTAQVNVDMKWGANSRSIQEYETIQDPAQYYEAYYSMLYNRNFYGQGMAAAAANAAANKSMMTDLGYNVYTVPEGEQLIGLDGRLNPGATLGRAFTGNDGKDYWLMPDNWTDQAYKNALRQEYNVSINGGTDHASYYASFGHLADDGVIEYSGYKRTSARFKADYQAKKWMKVGANVGYVNSKTTSNPELSDSQLGQTNLLYYTSMIAPIYPVYLRTRDANGAVSTMLDERGLPMYDYGVANTNGGLKRTFLSPGNPLGANRFNEVISLGNQLNGNFTLDIFFTDWLKFNATSTVIWGETQYSTYGSSLVLPKSSVGGEITKYTSTSLRTNNLQTLNFYKTFGKHDVNVLLGHEYYKSETKYLDATAKGAFSEEIREINAFATKSDAHSYTTPYNVEGYFGSAQYNYDSKYYGSFSYRRDASSYFAKDHRWGNFWSLGGAWILSKENFMKDINWVDNLKLKLSIGQQGNDNIGSWAYIDTYSLSKATETTMAASFRQVGNPEISWETTTNFNVGLEFALLGNRLQGSIDLYNKKTTDLLFWLSLPESVGSRGYYGNIGDIRNSGVELNLNAVALKTKDFEWTVQANLAHNSTKILALPESKVLDKGGFLEGSYWYRVGGPLYNYFTYSYAGVDEKGQALYWYDEDLSDMGNSSSNINNTPGKKKSGTTTDINHATRYEHGSNLPKLFGGFGTSVSYKGFDASVTFDYQIGGRVYDSRYATLMTPVAGTPNGYTFHKDYAKAWSPNNTQSDIPRWQYGDTNAASASDRWFTNASYLNFQSFTVGYTLPKKLINHISNIRIYAAGENLCFWSARKGLDPRYSYGGNNSINAYSPVRNISGGVQITF